MASLTVALATALAFAPGPAALSPTCLVPLPACRMVLGLSRDKQKTSKTPKSLPKRQWRFLGNSSPAEESDPPRMPFALPTFAFQSQDADDVASPTPKASLPRSAVPSVAALPSITLPPVTLPPVGLPSFAPRRDQQETIDARTPEPELEPADAVALAAPVEQESAIVAISLQLMATVSVLAELVVAQTQLRFLKMLKSWSDLLAAKAAEVAAAPGKLVERVQQSAYMAPFYARAAAELAVEDASTKLQAFKAETTRLVVEAPQTAKARAQQTLAELAAKPEALVQRVAARVRAVLEEAKAKSNEALEQAKQARDGLASEQ